MRPILSDGCIDSYPETVYRNTVHFFCRHFSLLCVERMVLSCRCWRLTRVLSIGELYSTGGELRVECGG